MTPAGDAVRGNPSRVIALLNALGAGDVDLLRAKLDEAALACAEIGRAELTEALGEAGEALDAGDLKTFRRRVTMVVSKLGHLR